MPGKKGAQRVAVADAEDKDLSYWEGRGRDDFDSGKWNGDQYEQKNIAQLATIRAELRRRGLDLVPHAWLDGTEEPSRRDDGGLSEEEVERAFGGGAHERQAGEG